MIKHASKVGLTPVKCVKAIGDYSLPNQKVIKIAPKTKTVLHSAFNNFSKDERKVIQSNLAEEEFYTSSIDGLYGRGTAAALKAYNKQYLCNADLGKSSNAKALMDDLLKAKPTEATESETAASSEAIVEEPKVAEPAPEPPLDFAQVKAAYDAGEYRKAFTDAQVLALQGEADAQLLLGKMFADGRGTLQVTTAAHMWFNIASMSGSDEAYEQRKAVTALMTPSAVEKAQGMAMKCIQSAYTDCGLLTKPAAKEVKPEVTDAASLKSSFKDQTLLKRKQLQYALKKLGVYSSSVDGLWGNGTATAFTNYQTIQDAKTETPDALFDMILSKVDVPASFAAPKKNNAQPVKPKFKNERGFTSYGNPSMSVGQAIDVCKNHARNAGDRAGDAAAFKSV